MIYLDNAATTKPNNSVLNAMMPYLTDYYGNASSGYFLGTKSNKAIEEVRKIIAKEINAKGNEIYFTSGATESNNWIINSIIKSFPEKKHIITTKTEHKSVLNPIKELEAKGYDVTYLSTDNEGKIDIDLLEKSITENTIFISIIHTNNETGIIQNIKEIGEIAYKNGIPFHTDATQGYGKSKIDVKAEHISCMTVSGHKLFTPKGVGFLYCSENIPLEKEFYGGSQEFGLRAGTENVAGIVALGKATELINEFHIKKIDNYNLTQYMAKRILNEISDVYINGLSFNDINNIVNIMIKGISNNSLVYQMDIKDICISAGSACSQGSLEPSYVLKAMGLSDEDANSSVRLSLSYENTKEEIDIFVDTLKKIVNRLR